MKKKVMLAGKRKKVFSKKKKVRSIKRTKKVGPAESKFKRPAISSKSARAKGHAFERWCAEQFRTVFPNAERHLEYQKEHAEAGKDLAQTGEYLVQCKRGRRWASLSAILQIQIDPIEGGVPILVTKGDDKEALAALPFAHFLKLVSFFEEHRQGKLPLTGSSGAFDDLLDEEE